jgi:hypothetical protein
MIRRRRPENLIQEGSFPTHVLTAMYDLAPACKVEACPDVRTARRRPVFIKDIFIFLRHIFLAKH